jgi:hypothetical protein
VGGVRLTLDADGKHRQTHLSMRFRTLTDACTRHLGMHMNLTSR